jgi:anaerobic magnesium-protoporphyrin IX monomethyl ester cyclase
MKLLLLNPPHPAIGSRIPDEHLPPLGLLSLGGPLIDAGHEVKLLDGEFGPMSLESIVAEATRFMPDVVMMGHSGSTSGHPSAMRVARAIREALPSVKIVYGGVFPTFHWVEIMRGEPVIDVIVRGEGERVAVELVAVLAGGRSLASVRGIVWRENGSPRVNPPAPSIENLDDWRVGWELIDHSRYTYWGNKRAVVVQFSRGCPHRCAYCGQRGFWRKWRHRDPVKFARELARLHREQGVEVINFADENPTASREAWRIFLEALIAENVPLILVGSTRAGDIVRDADILDLYRKAGLARLLMGIESADAGTLERIRKGSTEAIDRQAIRLLRDHGIISMAAWVAGFTEETDGDYARKLRMVLSYDPDQIQLLYATPHAWTAFGREHAETKVVQTDLARWDYKHQVLESKHVPNWRVLFWMKFTEAVAQLRPRSLFRLYAHPDTGFRAAMRWYYRIGRKVWLHEVWQWLFHDRRTDGSFTVSRFFEFGAEARPGSFVCSTTRPQVAISPRPLAVPSP